MARTLFWSEASVNGKSVCFIWDMFTGMCLSINLLGCIHLLLDISGTFLRNCTHNFIKDICEIGPWELGLEQGQERQKCSELWGEVFDIREGKARRKQEFNVTSSQVTIHSMLLIEMPSRSKTLKRQKLPHTSRQHETHSNRKYPLVPW